MSRRGDSPGPVGLLLERLEGVRRHGDFYRAFCPAHDDRKTPNLDVREGEDGRALVICRAGCDTEQVVGALGLTMRDLFAEGGHPGRGEQKEVAPPAAAQPCTLEAYAVAKKLPAGFLRRLGLSDFSYSGTPAIRIPYRDVEGIEVAVRFRLALEKGEEGDDRFRWRRGDKAIPYGLWRLGRAREAGYVVLVEGESDCHTLWHHGVEALGVPGACNWKEEWSAYLDGIEKVYAIVEPDGGGEAFREKLSACASVRERLRFVKLGEKDPSALHLSDPDRFLDNLRAAFGRTKPWTDEARAEEEAHARDTWEACEELAREKSILDRFAGTLRHSGVAGESRVAKLLYLAVTSRLLERPVSVAVKGPSSGGKSYLTESVLRFFPEDAYHALTAMSERTLAYSEEPIKHRFLVVYEAAGMSGEFATYLVRSLLSEGRVRYETVEKTPQGLKARVIEREGPTGLIVTTTAIGLHPENETRLLSLTVADTQEQTRDVLVAIAREKDEGVEFGSWHALQEWLGSPAACRRVTIPYAEALAGLVPPVAVRLRRDFGAVLNLIRTHAILHQANRERDEEDRIVATLEDYEAVRDLTEDLISDGIDATVPATVREAVAAVGRLREDAEGDPISLAAVARELDLDKSAASRRVRRAVDAGYLKNLEDKRGKPARLVPGDPLPEDLRILPATEALHRCTAEATQQRNGADDFQCTDTPLPPDRCSVAGENRGIEPPGPHSVGTGACEEGGGGAYPSENGATGQHSDENERVEFTI
jgi:hypothetical protein